jgi:uncharacterized membrane protein
MTKGRLEAFSDGVIAILITIMVLELKVPHGSDLEALRPLIPVFLSYVLSFIYLGIYWSNHHHLLQVVERVNGRVLWANLHLLFWLSLVPFTTAWLGENGMSRWPAAAYGVTLLGAAIAYTILTRVLIAHHGSDSTLARAIGTDGKGYFSLACYLTAIAIAFISPLLSCALYVFVAIIWLVPDRRIEAAIVNNQLPENALIERSQDLRE